MTEKKREKQKIKDRKKKSYDINMHIQQKREIQIVIKEQ